MESVKAASDLFSPLSGTVAEVNSKLEDKPNLINGDAYGDGMLHYSTNYWDFVSLNVQLLYVVYLCMCVCRYICMYVYSHVYTLYMYVCMFLQVCMYACIYV